jgi:hypothetical protein
VRQYIAGKIAGEYGEPEPSLPRRLRECVRRNYKVALSREDATAFVTHYKAMYDYAAQALPRHLNPPPRARRVDWKDIDIPAYTADIQRRFRNEPRRVVHTIVHLAGLYEYLK